MSSHRVSIGLPVYNAEKYLREALTAILNQTYGDFELIISDNGSTDRTAEMCGAYTARDKRIRYFRNEKNLGGAWNFKRVLSLASGEYFAWACHDDKWTPEYLKRCVEILDKDQSVVLCYSKVVDIDAEGRVVGPNNYWMDLGSMRPHRRFGDLVGVNHACLALLGLMRTSALKKVRPYGNYVSSDRVLLAELALVGRFYELPDELFLHREHAGRSTRAIPTLYARTAWIDPERAGQMVFPTWKLFIEYVMCIQRSRQGRKNWLLCYAQMVRFLKTNWKHMLGDIATAMRYLMVGRENPYFPKEEMSGHAN